MATRLRRRATAGHLSLQAWMARREVSAAELARMMGVTRQTVSQWLRSHMAPDHVSRLLLLQLAGIAPRDWLTATENQRLVRQSKAVAERVNHRVSQGDTSAQDPQS